MKRKIIVVLTLIIIIPWTFKIIINTQTDRYKITSAKLDFANLSAEDTGFGRDKLIITEIDTNTTILDTNTYIRLLFGVEYYHKFRWRDLYARDQRMSTTSEDTILDIQFHLEHLDGQEVNVTHSVNGNFPLEEENYTYKTPSALITSFNTPMQSFYDEDNEKTGYGHFGVPRPYYLPISLKLREQINTQKYKTLSVDIILSDSSIISAQKKLD